MARNFALAVFSLLILTSEAALPQLLFANRKDIRLVDLENRNKNASTILISHLSDAAALDFYYAEETIFWTDIGFEMIKSMSLNGSRIEKDIITTGILTPDGLACDWLGKKLYWTDSETNRIEVSNLDGSFRKVLFWKDLDQPRAITLVPMDGLLFWTDWGEIPKIERAGMDGDNATRKVIVQNDIMWPNGLTVDFDTKRVYWADAKLKFISSMDFDGNHRRKVVSSNLSHPFALTLYANMLYWTDWQTKAIHSCNKNDGSQKKIIIGGSLTPMDIHTYVRDRQPYVPTACSRSNGGCSHLCLMSPNPPSYACACPTGVRLLEDGHTCANGAQEILLLARRTDIRRISLDTPDYTDVVLPLRGIRHTIAIDYDPIDEYVYWTDDESRAIRRAFLNGTGQEDLVTTEVHHPEGVAVDWIARNLYWTDTGTDRIEVSRLNGTFRKILIAEDLNEPRAIVLDPIDGYMYWSDWGAIPKIERAALDGSARQTLINSSLMWPNGLAIDYKARKIYWGDAKTDVIEMAELDGSKRTVLVSDQLSHIFGFTLLGDYIYWTDWQKRSIERASKLTGENREVIIDRLPDLMGLKAVNVLDIHGTNPCTKSNGGCSHLCLNRPGNNYICSCPMGLELTSDHRTCIIPEAFLLFSRRSDIRRISLISHHSDVIPLSGVEEASALDYDIIDNRIYWTDTKRKTISRAFMNGSHMEAVVEFGLESPEGLAVDWVANNLYWADMGSNRIEVARLDGSSRKVLLWKDMGDPRSLTIDPSGGYMYWSDWGTHPKIEKAMMDGSHRSLLIGKVGRSNGLTVDYESKRIYWTDIDAMVIESSDLQGNDRVQVVTLNLQKPYGLTQYMDYIYWTDWKTRSIERANKTNGANRIQIQTELDYVVDLLVYHTSRQSGWNPCAVNNGDCSNLCLATPGIGHQKSYTHHCDCPTHYELVDNRTCSPPKDFLLFSQKNSIIRVVMEPLESPDVILPIHGLKNVKAIEYDPVDQYIYWVDGRSHTIRRSYDNGTKLSVVVSNPTSILHPYDMVIDPFSRLLYWTCAQNNVINVTRLSGKTVGVVIGGEHQKPRALALYPAKGLMFWVNVVNPVRIERANMDGHQPLTLVSDNLKEPSALAFDVQTLSVFWSDPGMSRIESIGIDGKNRKVLIYDPLLLPISITVSAHYLYWVDKEQQHIERANKIKGTDRTPVEGRLTHLSDIVAASHVKWQNHPCIINNGECSHLCLTNEDGKKYCSCPMELALSKDNKTCINPPVCSSDQFMCTGPTFTCIPEVWRCDGTPECEDQSDEQNCPSCKSNEFRCHSGECIDQKQTCDHISQCQDGSDESCCQKDKFLCPSTHQCIKISMVCNGHSDCSDGYDEKTTSCEAVMGLQVDSESEGNTTNYTIGITLAVASCILFGIIIYCCKRKSQPRNDGEDATDMMLTSKPLNPSHSHFKNGSKKVIAITPQRRSPSAGVSLQNSNSGPLYDRNHITGASSSNSSGAAYPRETLNPPPSPATIYSRATHYCDYPSHSKSYNKYYLHTNRPPPPSVCSTYVCEDSESYHYKYYPSNTETSYDSDPYPPPPTPRSHYFSDDNCGSCPPSPSTERSFYKLCPPPPSPVPESDF